ncbi:MAG: thiol reductant ABC exporter subunit CydC [Christensenellales bacterium]|jgi:thiol reductant ABC exporter CydC subunit
MKKNRSGFAVMMRLVGLVRPMTGYMLLAISLGVGGFAAAISISIIGGYGLVKVLSADYAALTYLFAAAIACAVLRGVLRYGEQLCNHYIAFKLLALIRSHVFDALRRLAPAKLEGREKGNLISILTSDIELLEVFYAHTISPVFIAVIMTALMTAFIGSFHFVFALIALAAYFTVGVLLPLHTAKKTKAQGQAIREQLGELNTHVLESLRGMRESIQYDDSGNRLDEMMRQGSALSRESEKVKINAGKNMALTNTVISSFLLLMLLAGVLLNQGGAIPFSSVLISIIALMSSFGPTAALSNLGAGLQQTIASGNRVIDLLEEEPVIEKVAGNPETSFTGADCADVNFAYGDDDVLSDISVDIPRGTVVGITGKSGSGKSTLLKLLMRFWDADSGLVRISGRDIRQVNTSDLRDMQSLMTQETSLFHGSIESNIKVGRPDATGDEVIAAAKKAAIHGFIETLPNGYATNVGELGDRLSGGERQRIGLARAFLHDADLMLLDEPTSNLDSLNEAVILKALEQERGNKTVVLVSHRRSTMRLAQRVYSVDKGRIS